MRLDEELVYAFKEKNYAYILERLKPLFWNQVKGLNSQQKQDFLQEYYLVCIETIKNYSFN